MEQNTNKCPSESPEQFGPKMQIDSAQREIVGL